MEAELIKILVEYRMMIGYLGEKDQFGWWQSAFFTQGSSAFLSPLFSRTQLLAQTNGVSQAAALVHDERIGLGNVFHLFRLPEDLEQHIHNKLLKMDSSEYTFTKDNALQILKDSSEKPEKVFVGPTRIGSKIDLHDLSFWRKAAGIYLDAFVNGNQAYPYFRDL